MRLTTRIKYVLKVCILKEPEIIKNTRPDMKGMLPWTPRVNSHVLVCLGILIHTVTGNNNTTSSDVWYNTSANDISDDGVKLVVTVAIVIAAIIVSIAVAKLADYIYDRMMLRDDASDVSDHTKSLIKQRLAIIQRNRELANKNALAMFKIWEERTFHQPESLNSLGLWNTTKPLNSEPGQIPESKSILSNDEESQTAAEKATDLSNKLEETLDPGVVIKVEELESGKSTSSANNVAGEKQSAILEYERSPRPGRKNKLGNKIAPNVDKITARSSPYNVQFNNRFGKFRKDRSESPIEVKVVINKDSDNKTAGDQKMGSDAQKPNNAINRPSRRNSTGNARTQRQGSSDRGGPRNVKPRSKTPSNV